MSDLATNIVTCHACPRREQDSGRILLCLESGKPFTDHAAAGDCPLKRFTDGPGLVQVTIPRPQLAHLWRELHERPNQVRVLADEPAWLDGWLGRVPCGTCKDHAKMILDDLPADFTSAQAYARWGWRFHNRVNAIVGHPQFEWEQARELWHFD